jgi:hypothetical protein
MAENKHDDRYASQLTDTKKAKGLRALVKSRLSQQKRREMMLCRIRCLPTEIFNAVVRRLQFGDSAQSTTIWLMKQDRGALAGLNFFTMRNYVVNLKHMMRIEVSKKTRQHRDTNIRQVAKLTRSEQVHSQNIIEIRRAQALADGRMPEPPASDPEDIAELEKQIRDVLKNVSEREMNRYTWFLALKRFELLKPLEDTSKRPLPALNTLLELMIKAAQAATCARRLDLLSQKQGSRGPRSSLNVE